MYAMYGANQQGSDNSPSQPIKSLQFEMTIAKPCHDLPNSTMDSD